MYFYVSFLSQLFPEGDYIELSDPPMQIAQEWIDYRENMSEQYADNVIEPAPIIYWPEGEFERIVEEPDPEDDWTYA